MIVGLGVEGLAVARGERRLFQGLSFEVEAGQAVALTGANGAGKTSLLRAIAGLIRPAEGRVRFEAAGGEADPEEAAQDLHLLGHQDGLKSGERAGEELAFQAALLGAPAQGVEEAIEALRLKPLLELEVRKLSAGQRRRLALARLLAAPRKLWLLDEPFAPLDAERRLLLRDLMAGHLKAGGLIVAAVHDPLPVEARNVRIGAAA